MTTPAFRSLPTPKIDPRNAVKRIGVVLLSTDLTTERDIARICPHDRVGVYANRIAHINPTTPENLRKMQPRMSSVVADILPGEALDAIYYSCTAASVAIGEDAVAAAIQEGKPGVPVITPTLAARTAFAALGVTKISILTPYLRETSEPLADYFVKHGMDVLNVDDFGLSDDRDMACINRQDIIAAAEEAAHSDAEALFLSCTALRSAEVAAEIEQRTGLPVITSNQASMWMTLRTIGIRDKLKGHGRIFDYDLPAKAVP